MSRSLILRSDSKLDDWKCKRGAYDTNPLLQTTKAGILERQAFSKAAFPDGQILAAIEAYDLEGSEKRRAQGFVSALAPLWSSYKKESYVPLFKRYIDMETGLEVFSSEHSSHVNHVIQEFLFGYNVLMNCRYLRREYGYSRGKGESSSSFDELFFSWMAASLLHDIGYDVERAPEEEAFRENQNKFWSFMTPRAITDVPLTFSGDQVGRSLIQDYILSDIQRIRGAPHFKYVDFEKMFIRPVNERPGWQRYDHGIVSAVKYLAELQELERTRGGGYLDWPPNRRATLAMALHNFRHKDCDLRLSFTNHRTAIAYLLIVCDEIQDWERERSDIDAELPKKTVSGRDAKKATELVGATFRDEYAFISLNHRLKYPSLREEFERYLDEKIILQKKHYPIRVLYPALEMKLWSSALTALMAGTAAMVASTLLITPGISFEINLDTIDKIKDLVETSAKRISRLQRLAKIETAKNLLLPTGPNPAYEVYVDHRIEGEPYLTVVFPF